MSHSPVSGVAEISLEKVDFETSSTGSNISTVIGLLPASLQSRFVPFRRLRRSLSIGNLSTMEPLSAMPPSSKSRPVSSATTLVAEGDLLEREQTDDQLHSDVSACSSSRGESSAINWRYAQQGIGLAGIAADARREDESESFERKAYIDGVTYLLRGLPEDLDEYETDLIHSALPLQLASKEVSLSRSGVATPLAGYVMQKSLVHRLVQMLVFNLFLLAHFLLPYIITMLKSVAKVERKYKISETIVGHGMDCFNAAGRHCGRMAGIVLATRGGERPEESVSGAFAWAVDEITRGVSDGVGEGLAATRARDPGARMRDSS